MQPTIVIGEFRSLDTARLAIQNCMNIIFQTSLASDWPCTG